MGDTTDELLDLAEQVTAAAARRASSTCCSPPASGSRWRCWRWRSPPSGYEARSLHRLAGRRHHRPPAHGKARIIDVTPGRIRERARRGRDRDRRRLPGRQPGHQGHHHARPRRLRHHRRRARRGAAGRRLRDLHRRRRRLHRRPADRPERPPLDTISYEEMLEMAASGAKVLHAALRRVRPPLRRPASHVRSLVLAAARHDRDRLDGGPHRGAGDHHRRRARPLARRKITVVGVPDRPGEAAQHLPRRSPTPRSTST